MENFVSCAVFVNVKEFKTRLQRLTKPTFFVKVLGKSICLFG